jgi:hypothetical protein
MKFCHNHMHLYQLLEIIEAHYYFKLNLNSITHSTIFKNKKFIYY